MFIVPRLMTPLWRNQILRYADIFLDLKLVHPTWPVEMLEPLTFAFCHPYHSHSPWGVRRSKALLELGRYVQGVWENDPGTEGTLLHEL